jgi:glycosyltransferase involved in cell wall biosynthesis
MTGDPALWPKITLVTPVFNSARYLEATIRSVLSQDYPNLEYVIIDGGSTDGTVEIIRKYEAHLSAWVSEPDRGMYDALNKGFARTTGEVMGWLNASDALHVGGLRLVGSVFATFPEVEWITGRPTILNADGMAMGVLSLKRWSRFRFLAGANRYIQQESTMWRRSLWERAGNRLDDSWGIPSDFGLWVQFFRHAQLYPVDALIGGYRLHADAQGWQDLEASHRIHDRIIEKELESLPGHAALRTFRTVSGRVQQVPALAKPWRKLALGALMKWPGSDLPRVIRNQNNVWVMRSK